MSKREKWHQLYSNLWVMPIIYSFFSLLLFAVALWADMIMGMGNKMPSALRVKTQLTQTILSTLTGGLLSLTSFTFYGVLTAVTTFAGQFSPRILKNFMVNKVTQRTLGIFCGSFLFVLLCLLFINNQSIKQYSFIPVISTLLAGISLGAFVFFISHIVNWLQVNEITADMKNESLTIIKNSLLSELDPYRVKNGDIIQSQIPKGDGTKIETHRSGYLQTIEFERLIREAQKDGLVIRLEYKVGNFVFGSTPLITYWKDGDQEIDGSKYLNMFHIGKRQTEIQDIEFSINKFVEIAVRALGNHDPKTATGAIYQIGDLLMHISRKAKLTPYLMDDEHQLRVIMKNLGFEDFLYIGFAAIRHYARDNIIVTMELLKVLDAMARGVSERDYKPIWEFARYIADGFLYEYMYNLDKNKYYEALYNIAASTGNEENYEKLIEKISEKFSNEPQQRKLQTS